MSGAQRTDRPPPSRELVLTALARACLHRIGAGPAVPVAAVVEHLGLPRRSAAARSVRARLDDLTREGTVAISRRRGRAVWELTDAGRLSVAEQRHAYTAALPESPQHRAWRRARIMATLELPRFRASLAADLDEAGRLLDAGEASGSDAWLELGERDDREASLALIAVALDTAPTDRAHFALSRPSPARIATIGEELQTANEHAASVLAAALARIGDAAATAALFDALTIDNPAARRSAASSLVAMSADGARPAVAKLATEDPDPDVRRFCVALGIT